LLQLLQPGLIFLAYKAVPKDALHLMQPEAGDSCRYVATTLRWPDAQDTLLQEGAAERSNRLLESINRVHESSHQEEQMYCRLSIAGG
jgi:hypothetical protein